MEIVRLEDANEDEHLEVLDEVKEADVEEVDVKKLDVEDDVEDEEVSNVEVKGSNHNVNTTITSATSQEPCTWRS